jgi:hypothetical protein
MDETKHHGAVFGKIKFLPLVWRHFAAFFPPRPVAKPIVR